MMILRRTTTGKVANHNTTLPKVSNYFSVEIVKVFADIDVQVSDYYPFDSKAAALLFLLANSPKPIVRINSNMKIRYKCINTG